MNDTKLSTAAILFAFKETKASLYVGEGAILAIPVRVIALPARRFEKLLEIHDKQAEVIDFCTLIPADGKWTPVEPGWADQLTDESHVLLYDLAGAINFHRAATYYQRRLAAGNDLKNLKKAVAETMVQPILKAMELLTSAVTRPASSAAPETKS